jgi:hypothetical protein
VAVFGKMKEVEHLGGRFEMKLAGFPGFHDIGLRSNRTAGLHRPSFRQKSVVISVDSSTRIVTRKLILRSAVQFQASSRLSDAAPVS